MSQQGQNQGLTFDQMRQLLGDQNKYQTQRDQNLYNQQQANRPWQQKNPGAATGLNATLAGLGMIPSAMFGGGGWFGKKGGTSQMPLYGQQTMDLMGGLPSQLMQQILGDQFNFDPIEALTRRNFMGKTMPGIMNRFNMGNNLNSGAQMGALGEAGAGLDQQLAAMRQQFGQQRQQLLGSLFGQSLRPTFENVERQRIPGGIETGLNNMMQAIGTGMKFM